MLYRAAGAWTFGLALLFAAPAFPETPKLRVEGDRVIYDTENVPDDVDDSIEWEDVEPLLDILRDDESLTTVELNSTGGSYWAAQKLADGLIDLGVDTHVNGECSSSCVRVFLAGETRTMGRGSRMGFHQLWWSVRAVERYFERNAEAEGWDDPFEFTAWVYSDTQSEAHERLIYMIRRGVDPLFAIETLQYTSDEMWHPWRARLLAAGVLTE